MHNNQSQIEELDVVKTFEGNGSQFVTHPDEIRRKLLPIRAFVFDWDGVFNDGFKGNGVDSPFAEADSMGTNLLRFGYWLNNGSLPIVAIITGQDNSLARQFAERENFDAVYMNFKDKSSAFQKLMFEHNLKPEEILFVFDDVLDLPVAKACGARFFIKTNGIILLRHYVQEHGLADFISGNTGGSHGVREVCEVLLGLKDLYSRVVTHRMEYSETYQKYLERRYAQKTRRYLLRDGKIELN